LPITERYGGWVSCQGAAEMASRAGCLPCGLAGALTGGSVPAQVTRPQSAFELGE